MAHGIPASQGVPNSPQLTRRSGAAGNRSGCRSPKGRDSATRAPLVQVPVSFYLAQTHPKPGTSYSATRQRTRASLEPPQSNMRAADPTPPRAGTTPKETRMSVRYLASIAWSAVARPSTSSPSGRTRWSASGSAAREGWPHGPARWRTTGTCPTEPVSTALVGPSLTQPANGTAHCSDW
jgi:hypothetical protein